jgi:hypothetical protein
VSRLSNERVAQRCRSLLDLVADEVARSRVLFPDNATNHAALAEEAGEVARALLDLERGRCDRAQLVTECIQLAAMAMRVAIEGDASFPASLPDAPAQPQLHTA